MGDYGLYIGSCVGITLCCLTVYLGYVYYKTKQAIK